MSSPQVEKVAEELRRHDNLGAEESLFSSRTVERCTCGWRSVFVCRTFSEHLANVAVDALGLTEEWMVRRLSLDPPHRPLEVPAASRERAHHMADMYNKHRPGTMHIRSRLVTAWVDEGSE